MLAACDADDTPATSDADAHTSDVSDASVALETEPVDTAAAIEVGDPDVLVGTFVVRLIPPVIDDDGEVDTAGTTSVIGRVSDGPTPSLVGYETRDTRGDCRLGIPVVPHCDTFCGGDAACVADDVCQPYPSAKSVGVVTMNGIANASGVMTWTMSAIGDTYQPLGASLPNPSFIPGSPISLTTSGGDYAPFAVASHGVAALEVTSTELTVARDTALALTWTPPSKADQSVIGIKLDISHHGGTRGIIECTTDDDGALTIDAALVTALLDLGIAGLPTIIVTRSATGSRTIEPGRVDLVVTSIVELAVTIPGLVSCTDSVQCPDGTTCQDDLSCQ